MGCEFREEKEDMRPTPMAPGPIRKMRESILVCFANCQVKYAPAHPWRLPIAPPVQQETVFKSTEKGSPLRLAVES